MGEKDTKMIGITQASQEFGIPESTLRRWARDGIIQGAILIGKTWIFAWDAVKAAVETKDERKPGPKPKD